MSAVLTHRRTQNKEDKGGSRGRYARDYFIHAKTANTAFGD